MSTPSPIIVAEPPSEEQLQQFAYYKELFDQGHKYNVPCIEELVSGVNDLEAIVHMAENIGKHCDYDTAHLIRIAILRTGIRQTVTPLSMLEELKPAFESAARILLEYQGIKIPDYTDQLKRGTGKWRVMNEIEKVIIDAEMVMSKRISGYQQSSLSSI